MPTVTAVRGRAISFRADPFFSDDALDWAVAVERTPAASPTVAESPAAA